MNFFLDDNRLNSTVMTSVLIQKVNERGLLWGSFAERECPGGRKGWSEKGGILENSLHSITCS